MKPSEIKKQIEKLQDILAKDKTKWRFKTLKEIKVLEIELKIWEEALAEVKKLINEIRIDDGGFDVCNPEESCIYADGFEAGQECFKDRTKQKLEEFRI